MQVIKNFNHSINQKSENALDIKSVSKHIGRFAPTPSGRLHLGNLACSLLAWLSIKKKNGHMILRIEDLDKARCTKTDIDFAVKDLTFLGLDWQEGANIGGKNKPYTQSICDDIYTNNFEKLLEKGLVYPCFCSRSALHSANAPHTSDGTFIYQRTCYELTENEILKKAKSKTPTMRIKVPDETITFVDGHFGTYTENLLTDCGDFVLRRGDGVYAYQLAVVVDDARMGVSEVVRGADLLSSTARQIYLYKLLGYNAPNFYHCPLLLDFDGRRLSKRDGDDSLENLALKYTAEEIIGKLAFVYGLQSDDTPRTAKSLITDFSWDKIPVNDIKLPKNLF